MKIIFSGYLGQIKKYLSENWNNIIISVISGAISGAIIGALLWLILKKNKSYIASWLSTFGTFFAVFVSLYLSSKNDKNHKEEMKTMKLPYFRIDKSRKISVSSLFKEKNSTIEDSDIIKIINSFKDNLFLSIKILNINEVETLLDFNVLVKLNLVSVDGNGNVKNEGYLYCTPIKEISAVLKETRYKLKLAGSLEEQIERLSECYLSNRFDKIIYNDNSIKKATKNFYKYAIKDKNIWSNPLSLSKYIRKIKYEIVNNFLKKHTKIYKDYYKIGISNIYISCKTVLGTKVLYEYNDKTGETYYRDDKKEIYAGSKIDRLKLELDMSGMQNAIRSDSTFIGQNAIPFMALTENLKDNLKQMSFENKFESEYKRLHHKLNEIRRSNNMITFTLEEIKNESSTF